MPGGPFSANLTCLYVTRCRYTHYALNGFWYEMCQWVGTCLQDKLMKTFLKLAAVAALVAIQPVFAGLEVECLIPTVPDSGATALLTLLGVGGLVTLKSFIKKS